MATTTNVIDVGGQAPITTPYTWQPLDTVNGVPVGVSGGATFVGGGSAQAGNAGLVPFTPMASVAQTTTTAYSAGAQVAYNHYAPAEQVTEPAAATPAAATPAAATPAAAAPTPAEKPETKSIKKTADKMASKRVKVKSGDTLSKIAAAHDTTWQKLYDLNKGVIGSNPNIIKPGQELKLP